ncbi:acyl-CoA dehydratase activase [Geosporobacter ferrireducens]|uniref:2-hydroxyglutaryl-CoA dehydratase n=1 Tax=Geosporobacter ferrireducens TaxID=1424294 RepID=A0A1D8GEA6_9FIRM|nr:acyl-CoA dehydratase activase [Geosporobacter ferrireducens]AOT69244.1 2-hydroxyglutaryl-CoA dehydratase [Geosporobacter ferrireducens]MTI56926.1 2-hydroxyglutaryl-CoA dehydratase [Geosporobacter ferrireducens]
MISIGIDMGSVAAKAIAYDGKNIISKVILPTGWSPKETGQKILEHFLQSGLMGKREEAVIVGTGYGRIALPFVDKKVTEITCHGKGAHYLNAGVRTVIDIGGQDSKVIKLDQKGSVVDFLMNDKCAAGTGRFLQVMSHALEIDVSELSQFGRGAVPRSINSMCTVFAESEVVSLMAEGASKESIAAGLLQSVVNKTYSLASKIGVEGKVFFSGGVSQNPLLVELLGQKLNTGIFFSELSQFNGAIGAAVIGYEALRNE